MKMHARALCGLIEEHIGKYPQLGCEVGVWRGGLSTNLLRRFNTLNLLMVDRYHEYDPNQAGLPAAGLQQSDWNKVFAEAHEATLFAASRRVIMVGDSRKVAWLTPRYILDFVFIDGGHDFDSVYEDMYCWIPCVRKGGLVSGHDYDGRGDKRRRNKFGVKRAVDQYAKEAGCEVNVIPRCHIWWFIKQ